MNSINLAVEKHDVTARVGDHRLATGLAQILDGQPPEAERNPSFDISPGLAVVRAAMRDPVTHGACDAIKGHPVHRPRKIEKTGESAHDLFAIVSALPDGHSVQSRGFIKLAANELFAPQILRVPTSLKHDSKAMKRGGRGIRPEEFSIP